MRFKSQIIRDQSRETYLVTFPSDLSADRVLAWLRSVSGTLPKRFKSRLSAETMVFETWATSRGISHRIQIPKAAAEYIASQLRTHGRGITVTKADGQPAVEWTAGIELGMSNPTRQLRIISHADLAASLLGSLQALQGDETVLIQWVVSPAPFERLPSRDMGARTSDFRVRDALLLGPSLAASDELTDRRQKLEEQNLLAIGRVMAYADKPTRANELVLRVESALSAANSASNYLKRIKGPIDKMKARANEAMTPLLFPAQVNLKELAAVIAWPIGQPFVAGLPQGATRHLFATENIPTEGRVLGDSNYPGHERPIALDYESAAQHMYVGGATGSGKTSLMANCFAQDINAGYGAIVIDASNSESHESMYYRALSLIPEHRLDDVILMNVADDVTRPIGFNILEQGNPRVVADQVKDLFAHLYQDTAGVWTRQLLFHGIYTLATRPGMTFVDLMPLLERNTPEDAAWAEELIRSIKDKELRGFWQRWENFSKSERDRYTQPLLNRIWQLVSRPEARDIIGQSQSSFQVADVLTSNKILLVSLNSLPPDTASILGTLMLNAIWTAAQRLTPERANFLYLDEFQVMTRMPTGFDDMLSRARKHKLGVVMGTQYLEDVPAELKNAIINNARTRVVFRSSSREARIWQPEFGRHLDAEDFQRLDPYEAVAQVATPSGYSSPVTLRSRRPASPTGLAARARELSRERYGRPIEQVEQEMNERRIATGITSRRRPIIGIREWGS